MAKQINNQTAGKKKRPLYWLIILIAIVAALAATAYVINHNHKSSSGQPQQIEKGAHNQNFTKFDSFKLDGPKAGRGIVFNKPTDYIKVLETNDKSQASFSDTLKKPVPAPLGALHVATTPASFDTAAYAKSLKTNLSSPKKDIYKTTAAPIQSFLAARFSPLYDVTFSNAASVDSSNLNSEAWSLSFSAAPKKIPGQVTPIGFENYKGQVMIIVGKETIYYFAVYNTSYNWDNNSSDFSKVINSIKIDQ